MTEHVHDCIVVGAGPAGAATALQMARAGLDVVLMERGDRPGEKNVMSGVLIPHKLHDLVPDFEERAPLQRRITQGYHDNVLGADETLHMPALRYHNPEKLPRPPYTVFRSQFDAWFADEAVAAGAEMFTATLVEDLLWEEGRVVGVRTRRGDLHARVVVGADGVNSTVAEKSGLGEPPSRTNTSLIVREILDLPAERIEERFNLPPGEGLLNLFTGVVTGPHGRKGAYYSEMYTNRDSLSLTVETSLDVLLACGVPLHDVLAARERHPHIARLIQGTTLREYQAHLIPWGGVSDLGKLYGDGALLVGDAGRFTDTSGVGSWPSMASGAAAARAVRHACDRGDWSKSTLAVYQDFLDEEGMLQMQREAREEWQDDVQQRKAGVEYAQSLLRIARRYSSDWRPGKKQQYPHSLWGEIYYSLVKPEAPWYVRWPLDLAAWIDTRRWRKQQSRK